MCEPNYGKLSKILYTAVIHVLKLHSLSNFQYCPLVWYFCSRSDVLALEQIQKRMLRMVLEDHESSYGDLLSKCGMSMLEIQSARTLAIEVYKNRSTK